MPNSIKRPDERAENQQNINRRQKIIFQTELQRCESKVENKIEREGQGDDPRELARECFIKHRAKSDGDDRIQNRPHRPKKPARRRPCWFDKL